MIFATVGSQLPFDRLIASLDDWANKSSKINAFAQIGDSSKSPNNMAFAKTLTRSQFAKKIADCAVIVSHAGMGTVFTALEAEKPIILMPRLSSHGEHRNDHQVATVERLKGRSGIHIAHTREDLHRLLEQQASLSRPKSSSDLADAPLVQFLSTFISGESA